MADSTKLRYFDVAWFSRYDGPGCRTVLFLQGCHLRCPWCHSPHSWRHSAPLLFFPARCTHCGACVQACPQRVHSLKGGEHRLDRERCIRCGKCVDACPVSGQGRHGGALCLPTVEATVAEVWQLLAPQLALVRPIGGITLSGGEALLQGQAVRSLLERCHAAQVHTAVETSGCLPTESYAAVADLVDCWLFGLRPSPLYRRPVHLEQQVEANLRFVAALGRRVIIRTPIVAGYTADPASLAWIAERMRSCGLAEIQLLPCNPDTSHYYAAMGLICPVGPAVLPTTAQLDQITDHFREWGITAAILR
ncbi:MAG: glycyl-radical enzyme activating protein [Mycobacterium leprae]